MSMLPPPPLRPTNPIDKLIKQELGLHDWYMVTAISGLLVLLLLWHVGQAFFKRLWLLPSHPSRVLALNASTLGLLGIVAKPAKPGNNSSDQFDADQYVMLVYTVLICGIVGAFMPSVAASTDLKDMWSNVVGVGLLILSVNFIIFLYLFYIVPYDAFSTAHSISYFHSISYTKREHITVMACMFLLLLLLLVQAVALESVMSDMKTIVSERLEQLCVEAKPGYKASAVIKDTAWSWEIVERNTRIKLMMVLTSNPQNVMTRLPSAAIVGSLVLAAALMAYISDVRGVIPYLYFFHGPAICLCSFICLWRWARVASQEDRSFLVLISDTEPSYWRRKVRNFQRMIKAAGSPHAQYNVQKSRKYGFQEVFWYTTAFFMMCFVIPLHWLLVALIRYTHILSALLLRTITWLPIKALQSGISILAEERVADAPTQPVKNYDCFGAVCLDGEDAQIVRREFAGAANRIIRRQLKRAKKKCNLSALISLLQASCKNSDFVARECATAIVDVLHEDGAPCVPTLHVEHGYQFGWSLTVISLLALMTKIEITALRQSTMSEAAMDACRQAMEMVQLIDEQFVSCKVCSTETYASACASAWSKLQKKKHRWPEKANQAMRSEVKLAVVEQILKGTLESTERHVEELNRTKLKENVPGAWSEKTVTLYTTHTVCQNLFRCWTDIEAAGVGIADYRELEGDESHARKMIEAMVEHINVLVAKVMACCLSNLPTAVDMSTTDAVLSGNMKQIEKGLILVAQGKHIWEELQWPTLYSPTHTGLGQLGQWIHSPNLSHAFQST